MGSSSSSSSAPATSLIVCSACRKPEGEQITLIEKLDPKSPQYLTEALLAAFQAGMPSIIMLMRAQALTIIIGMESFTMWLSLELHGLLEACNHSCTTIMRTGPNGEYCSGTDPWVCNLACSC